MQMGMSKVCFDDTVPRNQRRGAKSLAPRACGAQIACHGHSKDIIMNRLLALLIAIALGAPLAAQDRYVGYYYPEITSSEDFDRVIRATQGAGKAVRVDFVNVLTTAQLDAPESPRFVFFAKGADAGPLIMTALDDDIFSTIYRARAILAQLTVSVRKGGFFRQEDLQYVATFYDLLQLMQFDELVITDGETWAHRVNFIK
jgi:hypothetical protein